MPKADECAVLCWEKPNVT